MVLNYPDAVRWYYSFARFDSAAPRIPDDLKLARMRKILSQLGNPHQQFPVVLIAGTKGKGSTAALLASVLHTAGYRTGLYTSPHLHTFRERVVVNGELVSKLHVVQGTALLQSLAPDFPGATFFEWLTAFAFDYFARQRVEIAVVEVGLGGRLDCTNVLTPRVSVITPISFDHTEILGDTLEKIAYEKAGIIKPNIPVVVAPQEPEALRVLETVAQENNAPLTDVARDWHWELQSATVSSQTVRIAEGAEEPRIYTLPLLGPHQRTNLATALATIQALRAQSFKVPGAAIRRGIEPVKWHARFQVLARPEPMPGDPALGGGSYIIADGAHNRASAHQLVLALDEVFPNARVHFVFGASTDKDIRGMLQELAPRAASLVLTQAHHTRAASPDALARLAAPYLIPIYTTPTLLEALLNARNLAAPADVICITGSLFIAAEAREIILRERGQPIESDLT